MKQYRDKCRSAKKKRDHRELIPFVDALYRREEIDPSKCYFTAPGIEDDMALLAEMSDRNTGANFFLLAEETLAPIFSTKKANQL